MDEVAFRPAKKPGASYASKTRLTLRKMTDRIQARAIRRCGELLKQIPSGQGSKNQYAKLHDGDDTKLNRTEAATEAGLSERQKKTALR